MKNIEFNYIKEIAVEKSFSRAAKKLGISQPALSNYVNKIEKKLGVLLFDRSISPIEITDFGQYYLEYANSVLAETEKFEIIISDLKNMKVGELKIGSTPCFSTGYLPEAVAKFHNKYSGIGINIIEGKVPEVQEKCLTGLVDMFLSDADISDELFDKEILFEERILMVVPKTDPINEQLKEYAIPVEEIKSGNTNSNKFKDLDLKYMKDKEFILLNEDQKVRKIVDKMFLNAGFKPNVIMLVPQTTTGLAMTMEGVGISFVAESTIKYSDLCRQPIYYRIGNLKEATREMCIAYKKNKYISNAGRMFIKELQTSFK